MPEVAPGPLPSATTRRLFATIAVSPVELPIVRLKRLRRNPRLRHLSPDRVSGASDRSASPR